MSRNDQEIEKSRLLAQPPRTPEKIQIIPEKMLKNEGKIVCFAFYIGNPNGNVHFWRLQAPKMCISKI